MPDTNFEDAVGMPDEVALAFGTQVNIKAKLKFGIGQGKDFRSSTMDLLPTALAPATMKDIGAMSKAVLLQQWTLNIANTTATFDVPALAYSDKQALLVKVSGYVSSIDERVQKAVVIPYYDTSRDLEADANKIKSIIRISGADNTGVTDIKVDSYSIIRQQ